MSDEEEASYVDVLFKLLNDIELEEKYKDHQLKGGLKEFRECHIKSQRGQTFFRKQNLK
jgi:mRNA interferase YafQ